MRRSRGVSEVVSSVSMLVITMAVLGGIGIIGIGSLRSASGVLLTGSRNVADEAGILLTVVGTQSNQTGTYIWLFNYGWTEGRLSFVYLNAGLAADWTSSCSILAPQQVCFIRMPAGTHGTVSVAFGDRTVGLSV